MLTLTEKTLLFVMISHISSFNRSQLVAIEVTIPYFVAVDK